MVKAAPEAFDAAKTAYTLYGWLLQEMAKEFGWEKAIEMHARLGDRWAGIVGGMFREQCGERTLDAASVASVVERVAQGLGADCEVEARNGAVTNRIGRCPIYEGLSAAGIDHAMIDRLCNAAEIRALEQMHASFPELAGSFKFREKAEDVCVEEYALAK